MRTQAEVEAALRFARARHEQARVAHITSRRGSALFHTSRTERDLWASRVDAYEFVLGVEEGKESK